MVSSSSYKYPYRYNDCVVVVLNGSTSTSSTFSSNPAPLDVFRRRGFPKVSYLVDNVWMLIFHVLLKNQSTTQQLQRKRTNVGECNEDEACLL
jgi:hypothetical protein